jgi:hypothetical protein
MVFLFFKSPLQAIHLIAQPENSGTDIRRDIMVYPTLEIKIAHLSLPWTAAVRNQPQVSVKNS